VAEINLLSRDKERKKFLVFRKITVVLIAIMLSLVFLLNHQANRGVLVQGMRNKALMEKIDALNNAILHVKKINKKQQELIRKMVVLQQLHLKNKVILHVWDALLHVLPKNIYLNKLKKEDDRVVLEGVADSNQAVHCLLDSIAQNPWMKNPRLISFNQGKSGKASQFELEFILHEETGVKSNAKNHIK
jgi:type IV pilus assembly protein PilN